MISAGVFEFEAAIQPRPMPLELDNSLPEIPFQFGTSDSDEVTFFTHVHLCEAMKVGNLALHQWIITTKPDIFHNYIKGPIILNCELGQDRNAPLPDNLAGKSTSIVTYKTCYLDDNDK